MNIRTTLKKFSLVFAGLCLSFAVQAGVDTNTSAGGTVKGPGLAVHGYDAVAYFSDSVPTKGTSRYSYVYNDATYRFVSEKNLKAFKKNPSGYTPQFGGYCAFGVSIGAKFDGDPHYWKIVDGKLFLQLNGSIKANWMKDIEGNIKKARKNWNKIENIAPGDIG